MKSVLISIRPYWVFLIIAKVMGWNIGEEKTIEVRKNYPKDENWDKVAKIYCSKDKKSFAKIPKEYQPLMEQFLGKVIGEFCCNKVENIEIRHFTVFGHENRYTAVGENPDYQWLAKSCLSYDEERDIRLHARLIAESKAEAYKEFAERFLSCYEDFDETNEVITYPNLVTAVNDTLKEMECGNNGK